MTIGHFLGYFTYYFSMAFPSFSTPYNRETERWYAPPPPPNLPRSHPTRSFRAYRDASSPRVLSKRVSRRYVAVTLFYPITVDFAPEPTKTAAPLFNVPDGLP